MSHRVHLRSSTVQVAHQDTQCGAGSAPATIVAHLIRHDDIGRAYLRGSDYEAAPNAVHARLRQTGYFPVAGSRSWKLQVEQRSFPIKGSCLP